MLKAAAEEPPEKKYKRSQESYQVNACQTYFQRVLNGQITRGITEDDKQAAKAAGDFLHDAVQADKLAFVQKFQGTKSNKNFQWVRTFKESIKSKKQATEGVTENYYSRTDTCFRKIPPANYIDSSHFPPRGWGEAILPNTGLNKGMRQLASALVIVFEQGHEATCLSIGHCV